MKEEIISELLKSLITDLGEQKGGFYSMFRLQINVPASISRHCTFVYICASTECFLQFYSYTYFFFALIAFSRKKNYCGFGSRHDCVVGNSLTVSEKLYASLTLHYLNLSRWRECLRIYGRAISFSEDHNGHLYERLLIPYTLFQKLSAFSSGFNSSNLSFTFLPCC